MAGKVGVMDSADGSASARFARPHGVACDAAGDLRVTDSNPIIRTITLRH